MTKNEVYALLDKAFDSGGLTESMGEDLRKIKDSFDEREGLLSKYGEYKDGSWSEFERVDKADFDAVSTAYDELKIRYKDIILNGPRDAITEVIVDEGNEPPVTTFNDLFIKEN